MEQIVDEKILQYLASLARLEITPAEEAPLLGDLEKILGYVAQLNTIDTAAAPAHTEMAALRPDEPVPGLTRAEGLGQAPAGRDGFVIVQNVMGGEDE